MFPESERLLLRPSWRRMSPHAAGVRRPAGDALGGAWAVSTEDGVRGMLAQYASHQRAYGFAFWAVSIGNGVVMAMRAWRSPALARSRWATPLRAIAGGRASGRRSLLCAHTALEVLATASAGARGARESALTPCAHKAGLRRGGHDRGVWSAAPGDAPLRRRWWLSAKAPSPHRGPFRSATNSGTLVFCDRAHLCARRVPISSEPTVSHLLPRALRRLATMRRGQLVAIVVLILAPFATAAQGVGAGEPGRFSSRACGRGPITGTTRVCTPEPVGRRVYGTDQPFSWAPRPLAARSESTAVRRLLGAVSHNAERSVGRRHAPE